MDWKLYCTPVKFEGQPDCTLPAKHFPGDTTVNPGGLQYIPLNDFTCRETGLHNADWFIRMITLGSIQRYAV